MSHSNPSERAWEKLSQVAVHGAVYDSRERLPHPKCLKNTRTNLLKHVYGFLDNPDKSQLVWLHGTAGVGKSAVAFTVAERMRDMTASEETAVATRLAGTFFFSRTNTNRRTTEYFFATLAYQLAMNFPCVRTDVSKAIIENPAVLEPNSSLRGQMEALFVRPLRQLCTKRENCLPLSFVIDALDELTSEAELAELISLLGKALHKSGLPKLHILLTSRSEAHVRGAMEDEEVHPLVCEIPVKNSGDGVPDIISLDGADVDSDICVFFSHSFRNLRGRHRDFPQPTPDQLMKLATRAGRRFIVASTMMKFIDDGYNDPRGRLQIMLDLTSQLGPCTEVYRLYDRILSTCSDPNRAYMHLSVVASLADPLPASQISKLLGPGQGNDVETTLVQLRSVMDIPTDSSLPLNIYHSSVRDYVSNPSNCSLPNLQYEYIAPHFLLAYSSLLLMTEEIPASTALLDGLVELKRHSEVIPSADPQELRESLAFVVQPLEPLQVLSSLLWVRGNHAPVLRCWLKTEDGRDWLYRSGDGHDWLETSDAYAWLETEGGHDWLATEYGKDWLRSVSGLNWLRTVDGPAWLKTENGHDWLGIENGRAWLCTIPGHHWLETEDGGAWLKTENGRHWPQIVNERNWLETVGGRNWLKTEDGGAWLKTENGGAWLKTKDGRAWLDTMDGHGWLQTEDGGAWLKTESGGTWLYMKNGREWLQTGCRHDWLGTDDGGAWLKTENGGGWLKTMDGHDWLQTVIGRDWLQTQSGKDWMQTQGGRNWLQIYSGKDWLKLRSTQYWLNTRDGLDWLRKQTGRDWLQTPTGRNWLQTNGGQYWMCIRGGGQDWLQTQRGRYWLQALSGRDWLRTLRGEDWLQTASGRDWQQTLHAEAWPFMGARMRIVEFWSVLEAVSHHLIVPDAHCLPAFQVIQHLKSLPDFLTFPVFLALRHHNNSMFASPQDHLPDVEIIHSMKAFVSVANKGRERSQSASDALKYACHNWAIHLAQAPRPWDTMLGCVFHSFWYDHLLYWLEMQWCLKGLRACLAILDEGELLVWEYTQMYLSQIH